MRCTIGRSRRFPIFRLQIRLYRDWERTVREQAGEQTVANVVQAEAEYQAEEAKPVYAEVIG